MSSQAIAIIYPPELTAQQERAAAEAVDAKETLAALSYAGKPAVITSQDEYVEVGAVLKTANDKWKFLDEERKITVTPLNDEVKRVNDWYRPALEVLKSIRAQAESMMGVWILAQRREEQRLMLEAEAAAKKVLATAPGAGVAGSEAMAPTQALVTAAAAAAPKKLDKVAHKPVWRWTVTDLSKVDRRFLKLDEQAVSAWVKEHGNKDVPEGVEVTEDVGFTVRR